MRCFLQELNISIDKCIGEGTTHARFGFERQNQHSSAMSLYQLLISILHEVDTHAQSLSVALVVHDLQTAHHPFG